jgi:hypothetical protein
MYQNYGMKIKKGRKKCIRRNSTNNQIRQKEAPKYDNQIDFSNQET